MKQTGIIAFLLALAIVTFSQQDSLIFTNAAWETKPLAKGIVCKQYHFKKNLFNANQYITIIDIKLKKRHKIALACEASLLKPTSEFGNAAGAIAAINGNFFDVKNGGSVDYIRMNDTVVSNNRLGAGQQRARHQQSALVVKKGRLRIAKWDGTPNWETTLHAPDIMLSGPLLLWKGERQPLDTGAFNRIRHPRTAIAYLSKKHVLFITVDGRHEQAAGMSLPELTSIIKWLKAKDGINMDGGGSTTCWINGQGVVNYPSDNKQWDHAGERKVANIILVK